MKVEVLKGKEIGKTRALYEEVFQDSREYTDYFYEKVQREGTAFAAEENNEVISELFLIPKHLICNNKIIEALYVYGVATKTQYRGQGCMDRLMKEALYYAKESSTELLYLIPVSTALYDKYGFHTVKQGEVRIWELSEKESTEMMQYNFESVFEFGDKLYQEINGLEKSIKKSLELHAFSCIYPLRDREYLVDRICRAKIEGGGMYLIRSQNGKVTGFVITGEEEREIVIMDMAGEYEKKEEIIKSFMKWQGRRRMKEYVFTIMIKELKESMKNIVWNTLNDEI